jgi:hypothetical protein
MADAQKGLPKAYLLDIPKPRAKPDYIFPVLCPRRCASSPSPHTGTRVDIDRDVRNVQKKR